MHISDSRKMAIGHLQEARRYVTSNPLQATTLIRFAIDSMAEVPVPKVDRLQANLLIAIKFIQVNPDMARGYCDATAFELQCTEES